MNSKPFDQMTPEELDALAAQMRAGAAGQPAPGQDITPTPAPPQDPYAPTVWGATEYDFRTPSGQLCRMRKLNPASLMETGLLDRITRLPGYADELVQQSSGMPPKPDTMPTSEDLKAVSEVLETLLPLVVVKPTVLPSNRQRVPGAVLVSDIDLEDQIAIMERAMQGVKKLDNFRPEPGQPA